MNVRRRLYNDSLSLLTDLYELTMAYGYWKLGMSEKEAAFDMSFRRNPFGGGYTVACGLAQLIEFLEDFRFNDDDLEYLRAIPGGDGTPIFQPEFINYLRDIPLRIDLDAIPEGTVVFPHEPLVRVTGPLLECQILETAILNTINFQTLIATKAARVCLAAEGQPVLEFGLRRAQGPDGGVSASRAAYVGGCAGTSNVLAGKLFGVPVKGTHAHSWAMVFPDELQAFDAYAQVMPNNCVFLVDSYDTLAGVRNAVRVAQQLRRDGHEMIGIRLDSGDLAYLSIEARKILDEAGLREAKILASGELDEYTIESLKTQGARIDMWGVGTRLATGHEDASLGGVYKLTAVRDESSRWVPKIKLSEQMDKSSIPGINGVRRFRRNGQFVADAIHDAQSDCVGGCTIVDPGDVTRRKRVDPDTDSEEVLEPIFREGKLVYEVPQVDEARQRCKAQLSMLHPSIKRLLNPHRYPAGLEQSVHEARMRHIMEHRSSSGE